MKVILNLATASLVLPITLIKNFLPVSAHPKTYLGPLAYSSWALLFSSIVSCMLFLYASTKFTKVVCGGVEPPSWPSRGFYQIYQLMKLIFGVKKKASTPENIYEAERDVTIAVSIVCFLAGLSLFLWWFFSKVIPAS